MGDAECTAPLSVTAIFRPWGTPCSGEAPMGGAECTAPLSATAILRPGGTPRSGEAILATDCNPEGCDRPQRVDQTALHCTPVRHRRCLRLSGHP